MKILFLYIFVLITVCLAQSQFRSGNIRIVEKVTITIAIKPKWYVHCKYTSL